MTFYRSQGFVRVPEDGWLERMLAARREMDALPEEERTDSARGAELCYILDDMDGATTTPYTTPFDRLFAGQYDPEETCLGQEDRAYVVIHITNDTGTPYDTSTVIQPVDEDETPDGVCAATPAPRAFIERLFDEASA